MKIDPRIKHISSNSFLLLGRILFGAIFFKDAIDHFSPEMLLEAQERDVILPHLLLPLSGVLAIIGGLLIIFGFKTKFGAGLIVKVLIPVTFIFHNFWSFSTPELVDREFDHFVISLGLIGAAFMVMHFGGGPWSIDELLEKRKKRIKNSTFKLNKKEIQHSNSISEISGTKK